MTSPFNRPYAPATYPHTFLSRCARGCCWTPYGHSADAADTCRCHEKEAPMVDRVPIKQLRLLTARDGHRCAWTNSDTDRLVPQHRQGGMGGRRDKHQLVNLLWLDSIYNGHIEALAGMQKLARVWGIKISLHATPERVPVFYQGLHAWFKLRGNDRIEIGAVEALDMMHQTYGDEYFRWRAEVNA